MQEKLSEQKKEVMQLQSKNQEREAELKQEVGPKFTSFCAVVFYDSKTWVSSCSRLSFHLLGRFPQVLQLEQNLQKLQEEQTLKEAQMATSTQVRLFFVVIFHWFAFFFFL